MKKYLLIIISVLLILIPSRSLAYSKAGIVIEESSGRVLYEDNSDDILPMASTTKIMTAITAIETGDLESTVKASEYAASTTGSKMHLRKGDELTLYDMIVALLFVSANDGATAIAEHISGDENTFAALMTEKARDIGCENTAFSNAHGLDAEGHHTTAHDLAKIASYAIKNNVFYEIVSSQKKEITINGEKVMYYNKNQLRSLYEYGIGGKTGYTEDAGRCLVSFAEKDGMDLISVVLNSTDMYGDSIKLLKQAYEEYSLVKVASKNDIISTLPIEKGYYDTYAVRFPYDVYAPLTNDEEKNATMQFLIPQSITAPVKTGDEIGRYALMSGEERILLGVLPAEYGIEKKDSIPELMRKIILMNISADF